MLAVPRQGDPLVRSYLSSLLQINDKDPAIRLLLARQEVAAGNMQRSRDLIRPFLDGGPSKYYWEALRITYEMAVVQAFSRREGSSAREEGLRGVRELLGRMKDGPWQGSELEALSRDALAYGNAGAALAFRTRLALQDRSASSAAEAAAMALSLGYYERSASFYFMAQSRETDINRQRQWFIAGLKSLQSGNLLVKAVVEAERNIKGLADDRETLLYLARLSQASRRGDLAEIYLKRLLRFGG